jgi:hypothetical protein
VSDRALILLMQGGWGVSVRAKPAYVILERSLIVVVHLMYIK